MIVKSPILEKSCTEPETLEEELLRNSSSIRADAVCHEAHAAVFTSHFTHILEHTLTPLRNSSVCSGSAFSVSPQTLQMCRFCYSADSDSHCSATSSVCVCVCVCARARVLCVCESVSVSRRGFHRPSPSSPSLPHSIFNSI